MRLRLGIVGVVGMLAALLAAQAQGAPRTAYVVCKHGCHYRTIQQAVDAVHKGSTSVVKIKPGTYVEGVQVIGHKYDGLRIVGTGNKPSDVVLQGKHAHVGGPGGSGLAQNGVEGLDVDDLAVENLWTKNYANNGIFIHSDEGDHCHGYLMKDDYASFNHSYGLYTFRCTGGRITGSKGWGHGDSAYYIGGTPFEKHPKWTSIDHNQAFENVLGYSGTNSKYVNIHNNQFFNNGAGVVPNTLSSEPFEPTGTGKIQHNEIFWNDFNYYKPNSKVKTVSGGLDPTGTINYPTGIGVIVFGGDGWIIRDNQIFGNFMWGAGLFSDPTNTDGKALSENNQFIDNQMGRNGTDANGTDFFNDGTGDHNCFMDNGLTATYDVQLGSTQGQAGLYPPTCPNPLDPPISGTGTTTGDPAQQAELATYVSSDPPCNQESSWTEHPHPKYKHYKPLNVSGDC